MYLLKINIRSWEAFLKIIYIKQLKDNNNFTIINKKIVSCNKYVIILNYLNKISYIWHLDEQNVSSYYFYAECI